MSFFKSFRKRGFGLTLEVLNKFEKHEAKEKTFFKTLKDENSYLNEFYRVKDELIDFKLIGYKLDADDNYNKVIFLTDRGKEVLNKIRSIESLLK
ncbi:MAG: hypothetical protein ACTSWY_01050 [Promethearchaeota archaeon]